MSDCQKLLHLCGQATDIPIIEVPRQRQRLIPLECPDIRLLARHVALVAPLDFDLPRHGRVQGGQFRPNPRQLREAEGGIRSEEHPSELQSLMRISYAVFCLKKK